LATIIPFSQQQAFSAKYWYERLQYTAGPATINPGSNTIFYVSRLNKTDTPLWVANLSNIAATQNANTALQFTFDKRSIQALASQGQTDALPAGTRAERLHLPAIKNMSLYVQNTGAAVSNFFLNYQVSMRRLTVADKLLMGINSFTADEQEALKSIDIKSAVDKGTFPIPIDAQIERTYYNRLLYEDIRLEHVDVTTSDQSFLTIRASESGQDTFLVLREIALEGAPAITLSVDRDEDYNYLGVTGAAFVDADDRPWDVFVPALNYLTFHVQGATTLTNVPIRVKVWHVKMSNILRVRFGLAHKGDVPGDTYLRAIAGVV